MSSGPVGNPGDSADAVRAKHMLPGWRHLQVALGGSLHNSVKRSRKLAQAQLRRKR